MNELLSLLASQGIVLVFLVTLATRLGAPVPAVPFLVVAGGLTVGGQLPFVAVVLAAVLGNILGDGVWFLAGRRWGYRVMRLLCRISLSPDSCVRRSESILGRWGGWSLIAAKFVPGVSVVAPPMAGALGMSNLRFLAYEMGEHNIRVNAISAGPLNTLAARGISGLSTFRDQMNVVAPLRRNIDQSEVGDAALFLCSPWARAITGEILFVDAGYNIMGFASTV